MTHGAYNVKLYKSLLAGDVEMQTLQEVARDNFEQDAENSGGTRDVSYRRCTLRRSPNVKCVW
jgi:hypothetical protein